MSQSERKQAIASPEWGYHISSENQAGGPGPRFGTIVAIACTAIALATLTLGIATELKICPSCPARPVASILPWMGALFYLVLGYLFYWRSQWSFPLVLVAVFVHTILVIDALHGAMCIQCVCMGILAIIGAFYLSARDARIAIPIATAFLAASILAPWDLVDSADRTLLRIRDSSGGMTRLPNFVKVRDLFSCNHKNGIGVVLYEDSHCPACVTLKRRTLSILLTEFKEGTCTHYIPVDAPPGMTFKSIVVLVGTGGTVTAFEGVPGRAELSHLIAEVKSN